MVETRKKLISIFLAAILCFSLTSIVFAAKEIPTFGDCGSSAKWDYSKSTKTLTITGSGAMNDISKVTDQPWKSFSMDAEKIVVSQGITHIGDNAFKGFDSVVSASLPSSLVSIGNYAFSGCTSLSDLTIPSSVKTIGKNAFDHCFKLKSVSIPFGVTEIAESAFDTCSALETVKLSSVVSIGNSAFNKCKELKKVELPSTLKIIGDNAFDSCTKLEEISYSGTSHLEKIGNRAFSECTSLKMIKIPSSVTEIGDYAFFQCKKVSDISFDAPSKVSYIGKYAFSNTKATTVNVPASTKEIGEGAFYACSSLKSLNIPSTVAKIGEGVTRDCPVLESLKVGNVEISGDKAANVSGYTVNEEAVVINGANQKYAIGKGGLKVTVNNKSRTMTKNDFSGLTIESSGKFTTVPAEYIKFDGNPISVTVDDKFLSNLSNGIHTIYVATTGGVASTDFTLTEAKESLADIFADKEEENGIGEKVDNPNTGAPVFVFPMILSAISAAAIIVKKK